VSGSPLRHARRGVEDGLACDGQGTGLDVRKPRASSVLDRRERQVRAAIPVDGSPIDPQSGARLYSRRVFA